MFLARAIGRRLVLAALFVLALSLSVRSDELAEFHAAVERATAEHRAAMTTLETSGQQETAAAVQRFRQTWQALNERFTGERRPAPFADDEQYPTMFMQVDVRLVGVLLTIDMGNRDAARSGLAPIQETLAQLSARSAPASR
jgi:hypothetical protein